MHNHLKVLSILFIAIGVLGILSGILFMGIMLIGPIVEADARAFLIVGSIGALGAALIGIGTVPGLIIGIGLEKRRNWARIGGIILAILELVAVPVGTAIGVYALWVLLKPETVMLFNPEPGQPTAASEQPA